MEYRTKVVKGIVEFTREGYCRLSATSWILEVFPLPSVRLRIVCECTFLLNKLQTQNN